MLARTPRRRATALGVLLPTLLMLGCATSPTGRKQLMLMPESQMRAMGNQAFAQVLEEEKVCNDRTLQKQLDRIGGDIAEVVNHENEWTFRLLDSEEVNAFALPGGNVAVYTGILDVARTNAGLAAIIAHEIGHVVADHGNERVSDNLVTQLGLSAVDQLLLRGSEHRDLALAALGVGAQVGVLLPFSRDQESEADELGILWMAKAGYDPRAAVRLWERMAKMGGASPPTFLSTHPAPADRADELRSMLPKAMAAYRKSRQVKTEPLRNEKGEALPEADPVCGAAQARALPSRR